MSRNGVYLCRMIGLSVAAAVLVLAATSRLTLAQDFDPYSISYFSNAHTTGAPDATLRLINDGSLTDVSPAGDLCASIYVFDNNEQMNECCSCKVTPNGLITLSVNTNLTSNTLTSVSPKRGVIKLVSSNTNPPFVVPLVAGSKQPLTPPVCDPTFDSKEFGIHGWLTHVEKNNTSWTPSMEEMIEASLGSDEETDLAEDCMVLIELGSGQGTCSCTDARR